MPIIKIDLIKGKSKDYIKEVLDISYEVMLEAFHVPEGDRYQIVTQHEAYEMQILDTGLGVERTTDVLVFTLITRPRTQEQKTIFYRKLVEMLHLKLGIRKEDVLITLVENTDENWSFFNGEAQFLNGDL
ncbi:tautomerase family protein [Staphylococcus pseudintermedius]|nr:tautomerase family protein [Staphylococcus pseudintermedius]